MRIITKKYINKLCYDVIGVAIEVHKNVGPGLLEKVYHDCMKHELILRGINFKSESKVEFNYKGRNVMYYLRCDLLIEDVLVVELKSTRFITELHLAQLMTYMRMLNLGKGIIINFNCINIFEQGQKTRVNEIFKDLP